MLMITCLLTLLLLYTQGNTYLDILYRHLQLSTAEDHGHFCVVGSSLIEIFLTPILSNSFQLFRFYFMQFIHNLKKNHVFYLTTKNFFCSKVTLNIFSSQVWCCKGIFIVYEKCTCYIKETTKHINRSENM